MLGGRVCDRGGILRRGPTPGPSEGERGVAVWEIPLVALVLLADVILRDGGGRVPPALGPLTPPPE